MKVHIDSRRCQGTALCVAVAPDVFAIQPNGIAETLASEVPEEFAADAEEAVQVCPAAALAITADDR
jgi:ferredoxin